jgi:hypothetical protein
MVAAADQTVAYASVGVVAWLMIRAGVSKNALSIRTPPRCPACGRRRGLGGCGCTE